MKLNLIREIPNRTEEFLFVRNERKIRCHVQAGQRNMKKHRIAWIEKEEDGPPTVDWSKNEMSWSIKAENSWERRRMLIFWPMLVCKIFLTAERRAIEMVAIKKILMSERNETRSWDEMSSISFPWNLREEWDKTDKKPQKCESKKSCSRHHSWKDMKKASISLSDLI